MAELPTYFDILDAAVPGTAINVNTYRAIVAEESQAAPGHRHHYIVASNEQVQKILQIGVLRFPIVIPKGATIKLRLPRYLEGLRCRGSIAVHQYNVPRSTERLVCADRMVASDAIDQFWKDDNNPVNFLGLTCDVQNTVPRCFDGLNDYALWF